MELSQPDGLSVVAARWRHCRERCACETLTGSSRGSGRKIFSLILTLHYSTASSESQRQTLLRSAGGVSCFGCKYLKLLGLRVQEEKLKELEPF